MKFDPAKARPNRLRPGDYQFEVVEAEERESKSGNTMISMALRVKISGREVTVYDRLTFTDPSLWKVGQPHSRRKQSTRSNQPFHLCSSIWVVIS